MGRQLLGRRSSREHDAPPPFRLTGASPHLSLPEAGKTEVRKRIGGFVFTVMVGSLMVCGFFFVHRPWLRAGLWRDEAVSVYVGSAPSVSSYLDRYAKMDYAPPLFDGVVGVWGRAFGFDEAPLAALAAVIAALALLAIGWAGGEIAGPVAALFAMLLAADSDILFWEFDQVRPYAFSVGCAALVLGLFVRRWKKRGEPETRGSICLFGAATTLLAFSHYAGTLAVACLGLGAAAGIVRRVHRTFWRRTFLACLLPGAILLPWLPIVRMQMSVGLPWNPAGDVAARASNVADLASWLVPRWGSHGTAWSVIPALLVVVAAISVAPRVRRDLVKTDAPIAVAVLIGLAVLVVMGFAWGVSRYVSIAAAMAAIVFGCLLASVARAWVDAGASRRWIGAGLVVLAVGPVLGEARRFVESGVSRRPPARTGIRAMLSGLQLRPTDLVVAAPSYLAPTLWYYGVRGPQLRGFPQWEDPEEVDYSRFSEIWKKPNAADDCVSRIVHRVAEGGVDRIVLVTDLNPTPGVRGATERIKQELASRFPPVAEGTFHGYPETIRATVFGVHAGRPRI